MFTWAMSLATKGKIPIARVAENSSSVDIFLTLLKITSSMANAPIAAARYQGGSKTIFCLTPKPPPSIICVETILAGAAGLESLDGGNP